MERRRVAGGSVALETREMQRGAAAAASRAVTSNRHHRRSSPLRKGGNSAMTVHALSFRCDCTVKTKISNLKEVRIAYDGAV